MRKSICWMLVLISVLSLSSCGVKKTDSTGMGELSSDCEQSVIFNVNSNFAVAPEGYYRLNTSAGNRYLTYIDKRNTSETILCSKPECSHVDERGYVLPTCNAFVGCTLSASIVYYNGYIYVLKYNRDTYDVTLEEISADGSVHKEIMVVGQSAEQGSYYSYLFVSDTTLLMVHNPPDLDGGERTACLEEIDIKTKEKRTVYSYTGEEATINKMKRIDSMVLFTQTQASEDGSFGKLMSYDSKTGKTEMLMEDNVWSYTIANSKQLFYYTYRDGLYEFDLQTKEKSLIRKSDEVTMYVALATDGKYIYMDNFNNRFFYNEQSEHKLMVCDLDGNMVNTIPAGKLPVELCDKDYTFTLTISDAKMKWTYIHRKDIANPDVTWSMIE